jgi:hypothetical protein
MVTLYYNYFHFSNMKRLLPRIAVLFIAMILTLPVFAQKPIDSLFAPLDGRYLQEKIYIQYDKEFYNPGNTVWFKAYLTANSEASRISHTMYAELIDEQGKVLQRKTIPILESGAASSFELAEKMSSNKLFVRAYTQWMTNFDSSLLYLQPLNVVLPKPQVAGKSANSYSIAFFPEGGDLVKGIRTRIAFKATDKYGVPYNAAGNILDGAGKKIATFSSVHDGMGFFFIEPAGGTKYTALWKDKNGTAVTTPLPEVKEQGISLSVSFTDSGLVYAVKRPDDADDAFKSLTIFAQMQNRMGYMARVKLQSKTEVSAPIQTSGMLDGVLQITVFNGNDIPVAERLVFVNNNQYSFPTDIHMADQHITKRGHNALQIDVGDTLRGNLSMSVTDADINVPGKDGQNIFSGLLLTSDLKGSVNNPAYYFTDNDSAKSNLDLVMMTNGWRRFKWENVLAAKWPELKHAPGEYLAIYGNIYGLSKSQLTGRDLTGFIKTSDKQVDLISIPVSPDGLFYTGNAYFFDTARVFYQLNNDKDKKLTDRATFNFGRGTEFLPSSPADLFPALNIPLVSDSAAILKSLANSSGLNAQQRDALNKEKTLEAVTVKAKTKSLKEKTNEEYASGMFSGGDDMVFVTEGDPRAQSATNVLQYLQSMVAGLQINTSGDGSVTWRGQKTDLFLDQNNTDIDMIQGINMADVAMIKVFRPPFFGAPGGGAGGAVAVYTKKGSARGYTGSGLNSVLVYGYSSLKQFYSPDYSSSPVDNTPDVRTTLYWQPYILLDKKTRRVTIPFYNNDNCKRIRVVIEGLNELGQLTREEKIFQ